MTVTRLHVKYNKDNQPIWEHRCEATRVYSYYNDKPNTIYQCKHTARVNYHGKLLCNKHAGVAALHELLIRSEGD